MKFKVGDLVWYKSSWTRGYTHFPEGLGLIVKILQSQSRLYQVKTFDSFVSIMRYEEELTKA